VLEIDSETDKYRHVFSSANVHRHAFSLLIVFYFCWYLWYQALIDWARKDCKAYVNKPNCLNYNKDLFLHHLLITFLKNEKTFAILSDRYWRWRQNIFLRIWEQANRSSVAGHLNHICSPGSSWFEICRQTDI